MKKGKLLNSELSRVISRLGHTDKLAIGDAGLPIPDSVERIDLALVAGVPSFMQVVEAITYEMQVEKVILASEIAQANPTVHQQFLSHIQLLEKQQGNSISIEYVSHQEFKADNADCKAVIRTGEYSPYANVILCAGVVF